MPRTFISFLGRGAPELPVGYGFARYRFSPDHVRDTRFSQAAIIGHLGATSFDRVLLLVTPESRTAHWQLLHDELVGLGVRPAAIHELAELNTNAQDGPSQWAWFASVLSAIEPGDEVVFDFTHGFRSVPIVLSSAIGFLQRARPFVLQHAYYGFISPGATAELAAGEIIDLAPFYEINRWADAVSALTQSADTTQLVQLSRDPSATGFPELSDPTLASALDDLTRAIKDVDMNAVATRAAAALDVVRAKRASSGPAEAILLDLVIDKFAELGANAGSGRYDVAYFEVQLILIRLLSGHGMYMQAFTVLRETIASIGMLGAPEKYRSKARTSADGKQGRRRFGEMFAAMCQFPREKWKWEHASFSAPEPEPKDFATMLAFWTKLESFGLTQDLHAVMADVVQIRNGLNHGWTGTGTTYTTDLATPAANHLARIERIMSHLIDNGLVGNSVA